MVNIYNLFAKIYVHEGPLWITKGRISMDIENDLQLFSRINPRILRRFLHTHSTSKMWYTVVLIALKIPPKNNTKKMVLSERGGGGGSEICGFICKNKFFIEAFPKLRSLHICLSNKLLDAFNMFFVFVTRKLQKTLKGFNGKNMYIVYKSLYTSYCLCKIILTCLLCFFFLSGFQIPISLKWRKQFNFKETSRAKFKSSG